MSLDRATILAAADLAFDTVAVPEWGGDIRVRSLTGAERDDYAKALQDNKGEGTNRSAARYVAACICDDAGNCIFTADDVDALAKKNPTVLARVFQAALAVNGIGKAGAEQVEKNSDPSQAE